MFEETLIALKFLDVEAKTGAVPKAPPPNARVSGTEKKKRVANAAEWVAFSRRGSKTCTENWFPPCRHPQALVRSISTWPQIGSLLELWFRHRAGLVP